MNTQDLIALAEKLYEDGFDTGAYLEMDGTFDVEADKKKSVEAFCAALADAQPKGDDFSNVRPPMTRISGVNPGVLERAAKRMKEKADERGSAEPVGVSSFPQKEFDALLDHIYEHGTTAEGVKALAQKMIAAAPARDGSEPGLREALEDVVGCFEAAEVEGLPEALHLTRDERLKDLFERRVLFAYEAAKAALAAAPLSAPKADEEKGWRTIESAPKDGTSILVFCNRMVVEAWYSPIYNHFVRSETGGTHLMAPTHWRELPPAPTGASHD